MNLHDVVLLVAGGRRFELISVLGNAEVHLGRRGGRGIVRLSGPLFRQEVAVVPLYGKMIYFFFLKRSQIWQIRKRTWNLRFPVVLDPHFYGVNVSLQIFRHALLLQNFVKCRL